MNFDEKTFENLLNEKLDMVDNKYDKREGSVIYDAMAPNSAEIRSMYVFLQWMLDNVFGDTAEGEYLDRIALYTKGLDRNKATKAICKLETDAPVEIGSRFTVDSMIYTVIEEMTRENYYCYKVECTVEGVEGNQHLGTAIPVEYVQGLTYAELTDILIPGEDEEDTEVFRNRWLSSFNSMAFGGNKADYKTKVNGISGVGNCKIYRAENSNGEVAGGNVRIVIIDSGYGVPSSTLTESVQKEIDPSQTGDGLGLAPIGHIVHVESVAGTEINITANITCDTGYTFEDVKSNVTAKVAEYLLSLSKTWADTENLVVRRSQIESAILSVTYVLDVTDTLLNGASENIILEKDSIPVPGGVKNAT